MSDLTTELHIEDTGAGKRVATNSKIIVVRRDKDRNEVDRFDISNLVRSVDVRLHLGEPITATLEVYVSGFTADVGILEALREITRPEPTRKWWRPW